MSRPAAGSPASPATSSGRFAWRTRAAPRSATSTGPGPTTPLYGGPEAHLTTNCWEAPEVGRPGALTFGLNATRGVYAGWGGMVPRGAGGFTVYRPEHWAFAGSDLYYGDVIGAASRVFGYEVDGLDHVVTGRPAVSRPTTAARRRAWRSSPWASPPTSRRTTAIRTMQPFVADDDARFIAETVYGERQPGEPRPGRRAATA